MLSRLFFAVLVTLTFSVAALAAEPRLLTPQDLWAIKRVGSPALSPDGKHAVFPVEEWSIDKNKKTSNLHREAVRNVMGGTPWSNVEGLQKYNPMFYAKNFKTPTLVIGGELDYRVPYGNALELYAALQAQNVPSRLVIFPDENHWVLHPQNAIHWHWEMQNWLARYIGGKPTLEKPTFKTDDAKPDDAKKDATKPADL